MKKTLPILSLLVLILAGCSSSKQHAGAKISAANPGLPAVKTPIVTPDSSLSAKVFSVNNLGRFVVLNFPAGRLPKLNQHMFLYRNGLKVAEVKIDGGWQKDTYTVADIVSGEAQPGDLVRDE